MTLGQKIATLRVAAKMSQEQLADELDVSRQSVSKWESGQSTPELSKVLLLANLFHITTDDLLREDVPLAPTYTEPLFRMEESEPYDRKYFGTDGFRGEANQALTAQHAFRIGRFLGWYYSNPLSGCCDSNHRTRVVVGKDTRRSSYMFEYAIVAGLTSSGADAYLLHVTTTPSVAYVVRQDRFDCGIMISASHNPFYDNGIKLVNKAGEKMDDRTLSLVERYIDGDMSLFDCDGDLPLAQREQIGRIVDYVAGRNRYLSFLIATAANSYRGLRIALDCANGSSWMIAKAVFDALGAQTEVINAEPDGVNINYNAGSTHIGGLCRFVREKNCDVGFAFDGDADRCIAVDENGQIVNGDHVLYVLACQLRRQGQLKGDRVVATVMSNLGLFKALEAEGMRYIRTTVGDRYVMEAMVENDCSIGGESSGHTILRKYASTGDGILTAIMLTETMMERKLPLSKLAAPVVMYPQTIRTVAVADKAAVAADEQVLALVEQIRDELGEDGRILLRESGTEPALRVMVECNDQKKCDAYVDRVVALIEERA
ncbi:MAG: phosphoglucosamine mutase [Ruminococcaceae bacterium]|nr:phosphoglucosamine mutase [Oscillospiraceae bacterium]